MKKPVKITREKMQHILNKYSEKDTSQYSEEELGNFYCITACGQFVVCYNETGRCYNDSTYIFDAIEEICAQMEQLDILMHNDNFKLVFQNKYLDYLTSGEYAFADKEYIYINCIYLEWEDIKNSNRLIDEWNIFLKNKWIIKSKFYDRFYLTKEGYEHICVS